MSKTWTIKSGNGDKFKFTPVFETSPDGQDVECKDIIITVKDKDYKFNFINLYQFMYFAASEELRQGLAMRYQRRVNRIPYEVIFKLSEDEIRAKFAKRRIELPIDELTMAIARNEAWKLMPGVKTKILDGVKPWQLFKGRK